jgi:Lon protease-like protein
LPAAASLEIPLFPLHGVLFPDGLLALRVFEARYMDMTRECMKQKLPFGVCLIREGREVGAPATPEEIGCLARITEWDMQQLGMLHLRTRGEQRFRILNSSANSQGLLSAEVELIPADEDMEIPRQFSACAQLLQMVVVDRADEVFAEPHRFDSATWVGNRLAEILPVPLLAKQKLLELTDSLARLEVIQKFLAQRGLAGQG